MDFKVFLDSLSYKGTGVLLWTEDKDGNIRVLLSRRRLPSLLGDAASVAIPSGDRGSNEKNEDAAIRIVHDELGLNIEKNGLECFYREEAGGVSLTLYSYHLNSMIRVKDGHDYSGSMWYILPDDAIIPDADNLTISELRAFGESLRKRRIS